MFNWLWQWWDGASDESPSPVAATYATARLEAPRGLAGVESNTGTVRIESDQGVKP